MREHIIQAMNALSKAIDAAEYLSPIHMELNAMFDRLESWMNEHDGNENWHDEVLCPETCV